MALIKKQDHLKLVQSYLADNAEVSLTWVETHGLITAMAVGPSIVENWFDICRQDDEPLPLAVREALTKLLQLLASQIAAEDGISLPCKLDPYEDLEGSDLASWCLGFMSGVAMGEADWYPESKEEEAAQLLLPFVLIAGLDEDPELDELWQNTKVVREMAVNIPGLLEELFLLYHAPEDA